MPHNFHHLTNIDTITINTPNPTSIPLLHNAIKKPKKKLLPFWSATCIIVYTASRWYRPKNCRSVIWALFENPETTKNLTSRALSQPHNPVNLDRTIHFTPVSHLKPPFLHLAVTTNTIARSGCKKTQNGRSCRDKHSDLRTLIGVRIYSRQFTAIRYPTKETHSAKKTCLYSRAKRCESIIEYGSSATDKKKP